jgi:hypothetical protein
MENKKYNSSEYQTNEVDLLEQVTLADYKDLNDDSLLEWLKNSEELPKEFWNKISELKKGSSISELLQNIRHKIYEIYGDDFTKPNSLEESRFTPLQETIEKKIVSCGAMSKVMAAVLRKFNIPTKLVDGQLKDPHGEGSHAWLSVYQPKEKVWVEKDVTDNDLKLNEKFQASKFYHEWGELQEDLEKEKI